MKIRNVAWLISLAFLSMMSHADTITEHHYVSIRIWRYQYYYLAGGILIGKEVMVSAFCLVAMGLKPQYNSSKGTITVMDLTRSNSLLRLRIGSKKAVFNGKQIILPVAPRFAPKGMWYDFNGGIIIPIITISKLYGYTNKLERLSRGSPYLWLQLLAPIHFTPILVNTGPKMLIPVYFDSQYIVPPLVQQEGNLRIEAKLFFWGFRPYRPEESHHPGVDILERHTPGPDMGFSVDIRIKNNGNKTYPANNKYIFIEMADGSIYASGGGYGAAHVHSASVPPHGGEKSVGTSQFSIVPGVQPPIAKIIYDDGVHCFVWHVTYNKPSNL